MATPENPGRGTTPMQVTWQRRLRTGLLIFVGVALGALLLVRANYLPLPAAAIFPMVLLLLATPTVFWWAWMDERSASRPLSPPGAAPRGAAPWAGRAVLAGYVGLMLLPLGLMIRGWHFYDRLPVPLLMWVMAWHLSIAFAGLVGFALLVAARLVRQARRLVIPPRPAPAPAATGREPEVPPDPPPAAFSRRGLLAGAVTMAPIVVAGGTVLGGLRAQGRFRIRRIEIALPRLPDRLSGLTITHVSDFHVGRLFRPEHLPAVVDAVNDLNSDLIAITGDTIDHSAGFLPVACEAFRGMRSRYGRYVVIGNHDLLDRSGNSVQYLARQETGFLNDETRIIDIGGERVRLAGLFWSRYDQRILNIPGLADRVASTFAGAQPDGFTIALAHHPHAFDALAERGVDLTLAGHTHGGQLMLTPPGSRHPVGGGNLLFRYIYGEYRRGSAAMYVTSGVGNWFPLRINAPAEVVQIRLV
jgi:predicted MPP superfamily phosphohydrolase